MKIVLTLLASAVLLSTEVHAQIPPSPTNVVAQISSGEHPRVFVTWQLASGPWSSNLYRSTGDTSHFTLISRCAGRSFEDRGVIGGRIYYYYVKSVAWNDTVWVESSRSNIAPAVVGPPTQAEGTIRGTIVDDSTGVPLRNVRVRFFRQGSNFSGEYDITDVLGAYEAELDSGRYTVRAEPPMENTQSPYRAEWFDNVTEPSAATILTVGNRTTSIANFRLRKLPVQRNSSISGTVTNETGQPIANATVAIMRSIQEMNSLAATTGTTPGLGVEERVLSGIGYARGVMAYGLTDGQGRFRLFVQSNGSYIVAAGKTGFALEYFDNSADPTQATIISAVNDTNDVDFSLRPNSASPNSVRGVIRDSTGAEVPSRVILFPRPPGGGVPTQVVHSNAGGEYTFSHVQSGMYIILAVPFSNFTVGFYKAGQFGVQRWQSADSIVVGSGLEGINVGVVSVQSIGLTRVSGISVSSNGEPLIGGRVLVRNTSGTIVGNGMSAGGGSYAVDALPSGQVTFVVDYEPYIPQEIVVTIPPGTFYLSNINIIMTRTTPNGVGESSAAAAFSLAQNYPNPFNPTTTIRYSLASEGKVSLKVFDILGRELTTLVNERQTAGEQAVSFDAAGLSSGIYYYRLQAGGFVDVKKMIVLR